MSKSVWLLNLADWCRDAGLKVEEWPAWTSRSRSSGGFSGSVKGIIVHHTASNTKPQNDCAYMFDNAEYAPIGSVLLDRTGTVWVGAAGATNCAGKGKWPGNGKNSKGESIPVDSGNAHCFNIEAANAGQGGDPWPAAQQAAYLTLVAMLCDKFDLDPLQDAISHFEWSPGRKYDPAGPSAYAKDGLWNMDLFRADVKARLDQMQGNAVLPPLPEPIIDLGVEIDMKILKQPARIYDSRTEKSGKVKSGESRTIKLPNDLKNASAIHVTVTSTEPDAPGFMTVWSGEGSVPLSSNANFQPGNGAIANTTITAVSGGQFKVYASSATHVVLDVVATD